MGYTPNNPYIPGDPYSYDLKWMVENLNKIKANIIQLEKTYTTPTVVDSAAEMTDPYKIYVYMGSELGYNPNHWYYYDFDTNLWVDGGVYGALSPDTALDPTSHNAVENSVITAALATKLNIADIDSSMDAGSTNPVQNAVITSALSGKQDAISFPLSIASGGSGQTGTSGEITNAITQLSGSTIADEHMYIWGKMAIIYFTIITDRAYTAGEEIFAGQCSYAPPTSIYGLGTGYPNREMATVLINNAGRVVVFAEDNMILGLGLTCALVYMLQ